MAVFRLEGTERSPRLRCSTYRNPGKERSDRTLLVTIFTVETIERSLMPRRISCPGKKKGASLRHIAPPPCRSRLRIEARGDPVGLFPAIDDVLALSLSAYPFRTLPPGRGQTIRRTS